MGKPMSATPTPESMVWQGGANTLENRCHTTPPLTGGRGWWGVHHLFGVGWGNDLVPMPPFPSGHETGGHTCAFALCQSEQDYRASSVVGSVSGVDDSMDRSRSTNSRRDFVAERISSIASASFALNKLNQPPSDRSKSGSNFKRIAASFDSGGGLEGCRNTSMAHSLKGSFAPFSTLLPNMLTAICDMVAAVCRWVLSLFQRKRATAATTAIMGFARISSLSQISFVSLMLVSNLSVLWRLA